MTRTSDWRAKVGDAWADEWRRTDRAFAGLAPALDTAILAAAPAGPFRALDVGCGAGATSLALAAARPDAAVTGCDLSPALVEVARGRAAPNTRFLTERAEAVGGPFDLLFSRHGVMFFDDPAIAFAALRGAARPGAALVFSCFADPGANPWSTLISDPPAPGPYRPGPFAFAEKGFIGALLREAGWRKAVAARVPFAYRVGEGADPVADALGFLGRIGPAASALRDVPDRSATEARLRAALERARAGGVVEFPAAAWIWTARA